MYKRCELKSRLHCEKEIVGVLLSFCLNTFVFGSGIGNRRWTEFDDRKSYFFGQVHLLKCLEFNWQHQISTLLRKLISEMKAFNLVGRKSNLICCRYVANEMGAGRLTASNESALCDPTMLSLSSERYHQKQFWRQKPNQ